MYKSFLILAVLALFGSYPDHAAGQATSDKSQTQTNIKKPNKPINSVATIMPAPKERNAEAEELYVEGMKLAELGQISQAAENFQQALRVDPEYADAYAALGRAYFKMREWQKAVVNLRRAAELNTRQRASHDAPYRKVLMQASKESGAQVTAAPTSPQIKLQNNGNAAAVKPLASKSETTRQPEQREAATPPTANATRARLTLPRDTNGNAASVKPLPQESETTRHPEQREEVRASATAAPTSPQIKPPQENSPNVAAVKPPSPESETTRHPEQREEVRAAVTAAPTSPQIKLPKENSPNVAAVKPLSPESETTRHKDQREEVSTAATAAPTSPQIKLPQENSPNVAAVKPPSPESETTRQPEQRKEASTPATAATLSPQSTLPQETNANTVGVKPLSPESKTTKQPERRDEVSSPATAVPTSPQVKQRQETSGNAAAVKPPSPQSEMTRQGEQREAPATATTKSPQPKLAQETNGNAASVKPLPQESETTQHPEQLEKVRASATAATPSPQIKLPQENNPNVAAVKPPSPESETTRQPEQHVEVSTLAKAIPTSPQVKQPQETSGNTAEVKPPSPESETTRQPEKTADAVPVLRSDDDNRSEQEQEAAAVQVSMKATPASSPVESKSVIPSSISDDTSLTKIYRIGPSDVLDVRINDSQSPQSTLFTVTPSGLLEHPILPEPLLVTGFTAAEIGTKIETELSKRALLHNPKVAVGVRDYASHTILVSGLVKDSGTKFLRREAIPLYVVVADAQPLPEAARVTVVRNETNRIYEVELTQAAEMNLLVRSGDVITLHRAATQFFYIGGEVRFPGEKAFRRGLTLMQAIIAAGGVTPKSKVADIDRDEGRGFLVGTLFNLKQIQSGKAVDPLLKPGDRIMILR